MDLLTVKPAAIVSKGTPDTIGDTLAPVDSHDRPSSLYVHVPFCFHKCHYCDFYSLVDRRDRQDAFVDRMIDEFAALAPFAAPLDTVFVGGGTPTLLPADQWSRLLDAFHHAFTLRPGAEFTVEANPETVTPDLMRALVGGGVNRVSVGAQSFDPRHLKTLERWHEPANVARAFDQARAAGIDNLNLDLIFGIPGQTLDEWAADLETALAHDPAHLSCYALTYEPNTALTARMKSGQIDPIDPDVEAAMFEWTRRRLRAAGRPPYEISNFARPGCECRHNLVYWRNGDWLAAGPSASGHVAGVRWKNRPSLTDYLNSRGLPPIQDFERADPATRLADRLMMGLRLADGLDASDLLAQVRAVDAGATFSAAIRELVDRGWLDDGQGRWRLTEAGVMWADSAISILIAALRQ